MISKICVTVLPVFCASLPVPKSTLCIVSTLMISGYFHNIRAGKRTITCTRIPKVIVDFITMLLLYML